MPVISMFYGVIISMYFREHLPPHFHAEYQGQEAISALTASGWKEIFLPTSPEWLRFGRKYIVMNLLQTGSLQEK